MKAKLKYLVVDTSRHGQERLYVRRPGRKKVRIWLSPDHREFLMAYQAALEGIALSKPVSSNRAAVTIARPDTFRDLCQRYLASSRFKADNNPTRQRRVRGILESCCQEATKPGSSLYIGDTSLVTLDASHVNVLRDRKAAFSAAANKRVKEVRRVFNWYQEEHPNKNIPNPAARVKLLKRKVKGFHSWTLEEVARFERCHPLGTAARLTLDLILYTAVRRSDVVKLGRKHVTHDGWLHFEVGKTGVELDMPIIEPLAGSIAAFIEANKGTLAGNANADSFLVTAYGKAFSPAGLGNRVRQWCDEAGLPHCAAHGVRKATSARLAELGCTEEEIAAITGHLDLDQIRVYTRGARRKLMAENALRKLESGLNQRARKSMTTLSKFLENQR